jgi:HD-like signal output (HDOD) protein
MPKLDALPQESDAARMRPLLEAVDDIPSIPETLLRILKVIDDPKSGAGALAEVIAVDAPLSAKILRLANSPFYRCGSELADIKSCVAVLGFKAVRQVAVCVSIATSLLAACNRRRGRLDYRELWRHSVVAGAVARQLGIMAGEPELEEIFTAGLLHDLGKFVIVLHAPATYDRIIELRGRSRLPLVEVEQDMLGYDHTLAGEAFGSAWRFPRTLTDSARRHHDRWRAVPDPDRATRLAALVSLADAYAHTLQAPRSDLGHEAGFVRSGPLLRITGLTAENIQERLPELENGIERAMAFVDLAS